MKLPFKIELKYKRTLPGQSELTYSVIEQDRDKIYQDYYYSNSLIEIKSQGFPDIGTAWESTNGKIILYLRGNNKTRDTEKQYYDNYSYMVDRAISKINRGLSQYYIGFMKGEELCKRLSN